MPDPLRKALEWHTKDEIVILDTIETQTVKWLESFRLAGAGVVSTCRKVACRALIAIRPLTALIHSGRKRVEAIPLPPRRGGTPRKTGPFYLCVALPWFRVHIVLLNDPGRLLAVHLLHTALVAGWAGSMAMYELSVFDHSDILLNPMWRQGVLVMPFMARLGVVDSWSGWSVLSFDGEGGGPETAVAVATARRAGNKGPFGASAAVYGGL